jgi:uncharacterized protein (DUF1684 family)
VCAVASCSRAPASVDPAYRTAIEAWRAERLDRLTAPDGWLALAGLYWLEPGENRFGSAPDGQIVLPDQTIPEIAGLLIVGPEGKVTAHAEPGSGVRINDEDLTTAEVHTDADGAPDILTAGRISFYVIDRDGRLAARVKDPLNEARTDFGGIEYFPIDTAYRVNALFEPYDEPHEVSIPTVVGQDTTMLATGLLRFTIDGQEMTLEPYVDSPQDHEFFLLFRDATSGTTTYGAGRFLSAEAPDQDGVTLLDFNFSFNPPCAYTPYATCPLPPPQNILTVPIEAGEMYAGPDHR